MKGSVLREKLRVCVCVRVVVVREEKKGNRERKTRLSCGEVGSFVSRFFICSEYRVKIELTMGAIPASSPVIWFRGKLRRGL